MPTRRPLPLDLSTRPFAVRDALDAGVTRKRVRAKDLRTLYWGTRLPYAGELPLHDRCATLQTRLPTHAFFSHTTAALLIGAPLAIEFEQEPLLHLSVPSPHRALSAAGLRGHKLQLSATDLTALRGIRATSAARTWCDLSTMLGIHDLVAVGDYLIHWRMPLVTERGLQAAAHAYPGRRSRAVLLRACELLNDRSESRPELILRVILVLGGLPLPQVNRSIVEANGKVFARLDLRYAREKVAIEYQGDYHRTNREQWRKDMSRRARLEAQGWYVIEINADDLREPGELVRLIGSVLSARR